MKKRQRFDGTMINVPSFSRMMLFIMPRKNDALVFFEQEIDVTDTLEYIHEVNRELIQKREVLTLFELILCAGVRTLVLRPRINRFVSDYRFYQRNRIEFSFVAKKEISDDGEEVTVKIPFSPYETLETVAIKAKHYIRTATSSDGVTTEKIVDFIDRLPNWAIKIVARGIDWLDAKKIYLGELIETDPMWCSVFFTNVGSFGLDAPFHHLYERGNCPLFVSVGKTRLVSVLGADGTVLQRKKITIKITCDERISEGVYMAKGLEIMKKLIEDPKALSQPPELNEAALSALALDPGTYLEN
ncbi:MAG: hypothetical protein A2Y38_24135 [Spirochaetes bacterium GWB1_59_5]|nr:MAG: hypothetical protein A2Y38_24135 [Spirochaetes bacterium GWB1_59_5]